MKKRSLSKSDVLHLGKLAGLELKDSEVKKYEKQLSETLDYIENLNELDTSNVDPTSSVTVSENVEFEDGETCERKFTQDEALKNVKSRRNGFVAVKKVL